MLERRAIIARRLVHAARAGVASSLLTCYHTKEQKGRRFFAGQTAGGYRVHQGRLRRRFVYRLGSTTRIIPGWSTATLPLVRLRAATVVLYVVAIE
jgi:hypothetical protein